jgi:hypothetical protein
MVLSIIEPGGRVVYRKEYKNVNKDSQLELNTSELANGVYILNIGQNGPIASGRLLIQH